MRVLLVEDDVHIAKFIVQGLREEGHTVLHETRGEEGLATARQSAVDILILDRMLPGMDGISICRALRADKASLPILMLTAKDAVSDRVAGLDAGADDYLAKPFAFDELLARLRALARRPDSVASLTAGGLTLDAATRRVSYNGKNIDLSAREFALLDLFLRRPGHTLSRTVIVESVWGYDFQTHTNLVDVYVNYLRRKLKAASGRDWIQTRRGQGYRFAL